MHSSFVRSFALRFGAHSALVSALGLGLAASAAAQSHFATSVVQFNQGSGGGIFTQANILGAPQGGGLGGGSLHVLTLGEGGSVTLGFDVAIVDGPGADFTTFENGFVFGAGSVFSEVAFVEVSTDGVSFARFPSKYAGSGTNMGAQRALCGGMPVVANALTNTVSAFDPSVSGGEAFDLADLANEPSVIAGDVLLSDVHFVRLVDCAAGSTDAFGTPLAAAGGADIDAVAVINSDVNARANEPTCELFLDAQNRVNLVLGDPNGVFDIDFSTLHASWNLSALPLDVLIQTFQVVSFAPNEIVLRSPSLNGSGILAAFAVALKDFGGQPSADQLMLQG
jgi:hypothetical protein